MVTSPSSRREHDCGSTVNFLFFTLISKYDCPQNPTFIMLVLWEFFLVLCITILACHNAISSCKCRNRSIVPKRWRTHFKCIRGEFFFQTIKYYSPEMAFSEQKKSFFKLKKIIRTLIFSNS
jgi:hypothetical protein